MVSHRRERGTRIALVAVPVGLAVVAWLASLVALGVVVELDSPSLLNVLPLLVVLVMFWPLYLLAPWRPGLPLAVVEDPGDGSVRIFVRERDDEILRFSATDGQLVDQHGHRWSFAGEALEGPREGTRLEEIPTHGVYWFAWSSFHPETSVYGGDGTAG